MEVTKQFKIWIKIESEDYNYLLFSMHLFIFIIFTQTAEKLNPYLSHNQRDDKM